MEKPGGQREVRVDPAGDFLRCFGRHSVLLRKGFHFLESFGRAKIFDRKWFWKWILPQRKRMRERKREERRKEMNIYHLLAYNPTESPRRCGKDVWA